MQEWTGAWSDGSKEWTPALRKALKHTDADDGVFWMEMTDFFSVFNRFSVVRMYSHRFSVFDHKWHTFKFVSEWDEFSAGGCMNNDSWVKNPQYSLQVLDEKKGSTVSQVSCAGALQVLTSFPYLGIHLRVATGPAILAPGRIRCFHWLLCAQSG